MCDRCDSARAVHRLGMAALVLCALGLLAGCADRSKRMLFDGNYYPAKVRADSRDDRRNFTATLRRAEAGLDGARAAAQHAGTDYCVKNFGTSAIEWTRGPEDDARLLLTAPGRLTVSGRCMIWQ